MATPIPQFPTRPDIHIGQAGFDTGDIAPHRESPLAVRAVAGVLRHAQEGDLPLFAWTLGLPQPRLLAVLERCFPALAPLEPMPGHQYAAIEQTALPTFRDLIRMLLAAQEQADDWLAGAIAAACFGDSELWQDLGLADAAELSTLMGEHFPALCLRKRDEPDWKRFLLRELVRWCTKCGRSG